MRKGKEPSCTRLKEMVRRFVDQKINDRNFDVRRDDKTAPRVAVKKEKEMANVAVAKESKEIALNGSLKNNVRKVTRTALSTMKRKEERRKKEIVLLAEGKVPKGISSWRETSLHIEAAVRTQRPKQPNMVLQAHVRDELSNASRNSVWCINVFCHDVSLFRVAGRPNLQRKHHPVSQGPE